LLLTVAGRSALDVYNTFVFTENEKDKYEAVIEKFEQYCTPRKNEAYKRYVFRTRLQNESENLRLKSQSCNFGMLCDSMIRDQIVIGVQDKRVRMQLLKETDLTLERAIKICQASECALAQLKSFSDEKETAEVDAVRSATERAMSKKKKNKPSQESRGCGKCGNKHAPRKCPAFGKDCRNCGGKNHFAKCCYSKKKVQLLEKRSDSEDEETPIFVDSIADGQTAPDDEWIANLYINGTDVSLKLDTGAQVNILPMKDFQRLRKKPKVRDKKVNLKTYDNKTIPTKGVCRVSLTGNGKKKDVLFVLVEGNKQAILGLKTCMQLGLIKRVHVINKEVTIQEKSKDATKKKSNAQ